MPGGGSVVECASGVGEGVPSLSVPIVTVSLYHCITRSIIIPKCSFIVWVEKLICSGEMLTSRTVPWGRLCSKHGE